MFASGEREERTDRSESPQQTLAKRSKIPGFNGKPDTACELEAPSLASSIDSRISLAYSLQDPALSQSQQQKMQEGEREDALEQGEPSVTLHKAEDMPATTVAESMTHFSQLQRTLSSQLHDVRSESSKIDVSSKVAISTGIHHAISSDKTNRCSGCVQVPPQLARLRREECCGRTAVGRGDAGNELLRVRALL